ncbi:TATA box-binding protein-associated factor RNA polymerase I subunit A isoform X1 [Synchiropus splendidus]|uniref:TATA box-binding protein-associated factor RNA polymerase I subunit A isoform X1 n=1 Tax=Synchiropus splendidus TaxID=270530 RepID=UPI00237D63A5|nr:TATA box-binding protein-associated factor RNA polymerase I subunit A isoform X1 [Synchiropus splendidus]XP_053737231.1 TATA box-binding protein-associated factor RNA polymerase I subunit A isoform X1 [Synchiropus splendidus]
MEVEDGDDHHLADDEMEGPSKDDQRVKPPLPLAVPFYKLLSQTGFHQSARECLEHIRESMLHHRWQEAAEYIGYYAQSLDGRTRMMKREVPELIWRVSTEILHHLPNSKMGDYIAIYDCLKHMGVQHYLMISLEQAFHLLLHNQIEDALQHLKIAESWRYGKVSAGQQQMTSLIQAYRSLLDYVIWCNKKAALSDNKDDDVSGEERSNLYFRQASVVLVEVLKSPGVWDPFILSYVEMLQYYNDHEGAINILHNYASDSSFPPNPNAQVYLYQYLLKQGRRTKQSQLINVLKALHALVPSHELMLEYSRLLQESDEVDDLSQALGVVLDMLDFACWSRSLDAWTRLRAIIDELQQHQDWETVIADKMAARTDWWPFLHFTRFHATQDAEESPDLKEVKVGLLPILFPDDALLLFVVWWSVTRSPRSSGTDRPLG